MSINYMDSYLQNYGQTKTVVNGNIIDDVKWNATYDGNIVNLEAKRNNDSIYVQMNNDDIMKLFELPAHNTTIDKRLEQDLLEPVIIRPIIMEEIHNTSKLNNNHSKSKKKHNRRQSKSSKQNKSTKTKTKSKSKSKSRKITPNYLKTIY